MDKTISMTSRVTAPDSVLVRELGGEAVLLNLDSETYFGLDDVGTRMWAVLTTSPSIAAAHAVLLKEYDVDPDRLASDLLTLVGELVDHGLLILT